MEVSVALCTYNGAKYLRQQLDSILQQTRLVDEIVICDDCSQQDTWDIIEEYASLHPSLIKAKRNSENLGSIKNFEQAISLCQGDIIFLSDQDDSWAENKVEAYIDFFDQHDDIAVLCSNGHIMNEHNEQLDRLTVWDSPQIALDEGRSIDYFFTVAYCTNIATGASMAIRRSFLSQVLPFPALQRMHHDEWIALIASHQKAFYLLDEKLFSYRIHEEQQIGKVGIANTKKNRDTLCAQIDVSSKSISALKRRRKKATIAYKNLLLAEATAPNQAIRQEILNDYKAFEQLLKNNYPLIGNLLIAMEKHRIY